MTLPLASKLLYIRYTILDLVRSRDLKHARAPRPWPHVLVVYKIMYSVHVGV